jgi:hypothetical protein
MKKIKVVWVLVALIGMLYGAEDTQNNMLQKRTIKSNMTEVYRVLPQEVGNLSDMFTGGVFYGRLRFNSFGFQWKDELEIEGKIVRKDHVIGAIGGSVLYKSAYLNGFAFTAGLYTTQAHGSLDDNEAYLYKTGKGVLNRYDLLNEGKQNITSLAQAYLEYRNKNISIKAGRQIFESFLTASNDTKMIPNTFEGVTLDTKALPDTHLKVAYLTKQKLRDHSEFHHILSRGDVIADDPLNIYSENDDSGMHLGLTESRLAAADIDDRLLILDASNKSIENFILRVNYTALPELISSAMVQVDYKLDVGNLSIIPALRYMQQFDDGAGKIGGANLRTITEGYSDPESLDSWLFGARVDVKQDACKLRFGYTKIADEGDIIAPWRGFPTGGFTRAMAQYNWYANTETYMVRADYDFDKAGVVPGLKAFMRYAIQDFDDAKPGVLYADSNVLTLDLLKEIESIPNLYLKLRMGHIVGDPLIEKGQIKKLNPSYDEARFEINYLF